MHENGYAEDGGHLEVLINDKVMEEGDYFFVKVNVNLMHLGESDDKIIVSSQFVEWLAVENRFLMHQFFFMHLMIWKLMFKLKWHLYFLVGKKCRTHFFINPMWMMQGHLGLLLILEGFSL